MNIDRPKMRVRRFGLVRSAVIAACTRIVLILAMCGALPTEAGSALNARSELLGRAITEFMWAGPWGFTYLCDAIKVPCGFELRADDQSDIGYGDWTTVRGKTVREILDEMMKRHPGYRWGFDGEVLIVVPVDGGVSVLDRRIDSFTFDSGLTDEALHRLASRNGINGMSRMITGNGSDLIQRRIKVTARRKTLRSMFCAIAAADGGMVWVYYPAGRGQLNRGPTYDRFFY